MKEDIKMKKLGRKALALTLTLTLGASMALTGCGSSKESKKGGDGSDNLGITTGLAKDTKGEVSIMVWSGDGEYYEDIGNPDSAAGKKLSDPSKIVAQNVAQVYAVAQKFHTVYPNIKINLCSKVGDPDQYNTASWEQEMENFQAKYKKYPDIWGSTNVINDIKKGLVADLSVYKDDATYKKYNETLMSNLNYYGFQAGLPSYTIPGGIWVNKALAEDNNINVPKPDWSIDEYTRFVSKADGKTFWGSKGTPVDIVNLGTTTINKMIKEENKIDLNSDEVKSLLKYFPKWAEKSIDVAAGAGKITKDIVKECSAYSWYYFTNNRSLVNFEDPWFLTAGADESAKDSDAYIKSADWDIYPYPSTDYCENTIKVIMDPICLHNYSLDDKKSEWSDEEKQKLDVTYTFASFWTASTAARQAIFDQKWSDNGQLKSAAGDTFPVVSGDDYDAQMEIWNKLDAHKAYADKEGFQKVLEIWKEGKTWDYIDKCWTSTISENGDTTKTLYEWINCGQENVAGAWFTDKDWADNVKSRLSDWNDSCNKRIQTAQKQLKDALKEYYGFEDADLK